MSQTIKARVIAAFNDRENPKSTYTVGDVFEGSPERVNELMCGGYLAAIEGKKPKAAPKKEG